MDTMSLDVLVDGTKNISNVSHPRTLTLPKDWDERLKLKFPKFATEERYKMKSLHLDKGWFAFDFLRGFLSRVQPYDIPTGNDVTAIVNDFREISFSISFSELVNFLNTSRQIRFRARMVSVMCPSCINNSYANCFN